MILRDILLQIGQILAVIVFAPLLQGFIHWAEERVQRSQGPSIFQPYRDLRKLFRKQIVVPETASWIFWITPVVAFTCMLTVPILIPVLTNYPLPYSDMGDILGGGLILTLGSFMIVLAGLDSGSAYGGIGSSRAVMLGILAEPTLILVFVGITLLAKSMIPFVVNHLLVDNPAIYWSPAHLFLVAAFFVLLLVETDAPYLAPVPHRGQRNESAYTLHVAQRMAEIKKISVEEVAAITTDNSRRLFGV